ncbi:MAG: hypothetical protein ACN4GW_19750 [Desulforhopalus sp.]
MNLGQIYSSLYSYLYSHPLIASGILIVLGLMLWKKPSEFFKLMLFVVVLNIVFYIGSFLVGSMDFGAGKKHEITTERKERLFNE